MSKKTDKKVIYADKAPTRGSKGKKVLVPTATRREASSNSTTGDLLFTKENYKWMAIGAGLILLGMLLMIGGRMPDPNTWDPDIIYSKRITVLAPFCILAGLGIEIYAIFKR